MFAPEFFSFFFSLFAASFYRFFKTFGPLPKEMELRSPFSPRERLRGQYAHFRPTFASSRRSSLSATAAVPAASQLSTEEPSSPQPTAARVETAVQTEPEPEPVLQPQSEPRLQSDAQNEAEAEEERQRIDQQLSDLLTPLVVSRQRCVHLET